MKRKNRTRHRKELPNVKQGQDQEPLNRPGPTDDPEYRLRYPVERGGSHARDFIERAASVLNDPQTAIYLDTSFVMWLTKGSTASREQFIDWADSVDRRIHVPVWTYHEYYRHHQRGTLRSELVADADALKTATKKFIETTKSYADQSLKPGFSPQGFCRELDGLETKIKEITSLAKSWEYEVAAKQLTEWMSNKLCRSKVVFDLMDRLGALGNTRYTQDIPPGFLDRIKEDTHEKGSNRFGDLLVWEEILAHVDGQGAKSVVLLTKDRKLDWFAKDGEPQLDQALQRLRNRWDPVPAPHPLLVLELRERTQARDLILLDNLYLGGVLHHSSEHPRPKFIAYALGINAEKYEQSQAHDEMAAPQKPRRPSSPGLNPLQVKGVYEAAHGKGGQAVHDVMQKLAQEIPDIEAFVESLTPDSLTAIPINDVAALARLISDKALEDESPGARLMAKKIVALLPAARADIATAAYIGLLTSAYFITDKPRPIPLSQNLHELFDQLEDQVYNRALGYFGKQVTNAGSRALFIPNGDNTKVPLQFSQDSNQRQTPAVLQQIAFKDRNLLTAIGPALPSNLLKILGGQRVATVGELTKVVAERYGLPVHLLETIGATAQDRRTIPEELGFIEVDELAEVAEVQLAYGSGAEEGESQFAFEVDDEEEAETDEELEGNN